MQVGTRQLSPSQFDRRAQLARVARARQSATPSGSGPSPVQNTQNAQNTPTKLQNLEARVQNQVQVQQDNLRLGSDPTGVVGQSTRQLSQALQQLRTLTGSGPQSSTLDTLQRFQEQTLPQNIATLNQQVERLQASLEALPEDSPERQGLTLQLQVVEASVSLYREAEQLLAQSPLLQAPAASSSSPAVRAEGAVPTRESEPETESFEVPDEEALERGAHELGLSGPELRNVFNAIQTNLDGLNALSNQVNFETGTKVRQNAGDLRSVGQLKILGKALVDLINPGHDLHGEELEEGGSAIRRTRALLTFVMESRRLEQNNPDLTRRLGLTQLNRGVAGLVSRIPNEGLRNIVNRYIGNEDRESSAKSKRRIEDLQVVLELASGEIPLNEESGRALFELILDNGVDAVKGLREALPPDARARFDQTVDRIQSRIAGVARQLGAEAPKFLKDLLEESPEQAKQIVRFLVEDGPGKVEAVGEFLVNFAKSDAAQSLLGEGGAKRLQALSEFFALDTYSTHYLRTVLSPHSPAPTRLNALNNLLKDAVGKRGLLAEAVEGLPSIEPLTGRALNRFADVLGLDDAAAQAALSAAPEAGAPEVRTPEAAVARSADNLSSEAARLIEREAEKLAHFNLSPEAEQSLMRLLRQNPEKAEEVVKALRTVGCESATKLDTFLKIAAEMEPAKALNMVIGDGMGAKLLRQVAELVPALEKYGLKLADIIPKLARTLGKVIPAVGALASAADAKRLGEIALTGRSGGKTYNDPEVRTLALLGASTNAVDTLLGVGEALGIGNVDFPVQAALAVGSLAADVLVEYFNDNPNAMSPTMRKAIRYTAAASAVAAPFVVPGAGLAASAAVARIYGADGIVDILGDLGQDLASGAIQGADKLTRWHAQALDKGLGALVGGVHGIADLIRNPERYAALLGKSAAEVASQASQWLQDQLKQGLVTAEEVFNTLKDVAQHPGEYAAAARDRALQLASEIGKGVSSAAGAARDFIVDSVKQGWNGLKAGADRLYELGVEGVQAAVNLGSELLQAGGRAAQQFYDFARDVASDPGKYGQMVADSIGNAVSAGWQATQLGAEMLINLAGQGIEKAGQALKNVVAAGGEAALYALNALRNAPQAVKEAIGEGLDLAFKAGKATLEMVQFVVQHPAEAAAAVGEKAVELFTESRDWLVNQVKNAGQNVEAAFQTLEQFYTNIRQSLGELGDRVGAALGRFEDTVVDLVGQGIDVGRAAIERYEEVLSRRLPELLDAWKDLASAPVDLAVRIGRSTAEAGAQVARYLGEQAATIGREAIEGLSQLGAAGVQELSRLASAGGRMASEALNSIAEAAKNGVQAAKTALLDLAHSAGAIGAQAVQKLADLGDWGLQQLKGLVSSASEQAQAAIQALGRLGNKGLEALEDLARAGGRYARQAFDALAHAGTAAIDHLRDLVTLGSAFAREAFNDLVAQGARAVDALKEIGTQVADFARPAIQALGRLGGRAAQAAEDAILAIGSRVRGAADDAIEALKGLGSRAVDSIEALANQYHDLRDEAVKAFSEIGFSARAAMNRTIDQMWASGQAGITDVMNLAGDIGAVSSRVYQMVTTQLSNSWERSSLTPMLFGGRGVNLNPLKNAITSLLSQARAAGGQAYQQVKAMMQRSLRELGVPAFVYDWL